MTKEETKQRIKVMQAYIDGKKVEFFNELLDRWESADNPSWDSCKEYRIKPKLVYRSFNNAKECIKEMEKHNPFGWVKEKYGDECSVIQGISCAGDKDFIEHNDSWVTPYTMFQDVIFLDGSPFGIKVEKEE